MSIDDGATQRTAARPRARRFLIDFATMTVIGIVLALVGPFGSFNDPLAVRLVVWLGFAYLGYLLYSPINAIARRLTPVLDLPEWSLQFAGVLLSSIPMAVIVFALPRWPDHIRWPGLEYALPQYLYVTVIGGIITLIFGLIERNTASEDVTGESPMEGRETLARPEASTVTPRPNTPFLDRLPAELGSDLIALEMEDHYVRAHTALGSDLILLRMRDAVAELGATDGRRVHRSWWVARNAVEAVKREGRNVRLVLAGGIEAPVSRANVQELKDAGWF